MKIPIILALSALVTSPFATAEDLEKPSVALEVKRQMLEKDSGRALGGESSTKTYTLRVQISNVSSSPVEGCELSGEVLVKRAVDDHEKLVKETITPTVKVPALKPNARVTVDLGKISVRSIEWKKGKDFEESLEEWKVVCTKAGKVLGGHQSSENYTTLSKEAKPVTDGKKKNKPQNKREKLMRKNLN